MNDIRSIDGLTALFPRNAGLTLHGPRDEEGSVAVQDRVEISDVAQALGARDPEIRADKVASVREALGRGDYLTKDKLAIAIQRAVHELESGP